MADIDETLKNTAPPSDGNIKFTPQDYEHLKDPKKIQDLIRTAFEKAGELNGDKFMPAGDFAESANERSGYRLASQWNKSLQEIYNNLNASAAVENNNDNIIKQDILEGNAEGTQTHDFLNPIPYYNKKNLSYLDSRTDPYKMNVKHMDYTDDIGSRGGTYEDFNQIRSWMEYLDINGDGVIGVDDSLLLNYFSLTKDFYENPEGEVKVTSNSAEFLKYNEELNAYMNEPPFVTESGKYYKKYPLDREKLLYKRMKNFYYLIVNYQANEGAITFNENYNLPFYVNKKGPYRDFIFNETNSLINFIFARINNDELFVKSGGTLHYLDPTTATLIQRAINRFGKGRAYVTYDEMADYILLERNSNNAIRLLMPQYHRRVEVEDLDKNFWVIAQLLDNLSQCLIGDNGIYETNEKIVQEISELWQNTAYLWNVVSSIMGINLQDYADQFNEVREELTEKKEALDDLNNRLENKIEQLTSLEKDRAISVDLRFKGKTNPKISMIEDFDVDELKFVIEYGYGEKEIKNIFKNSRVLDTFTVGGETIQEATFDNGNYDIRGTVEKFNERSIDNEDYSIPLSCLTINSNGTKSQFGFGSTDALKVHLQSNPSDYFRLCSDFKIVLYDKNYYDTNITDEPVNGQRKLVEISYKNKALSNDNLQEMQDKANEIIFYIPKSNLVNGEIMMLTFKNLCLQDCVPKNSLWTDTGNYRFWKSSLYINQNTNESEINNQVSVVFKNANLIDYELKKSNYFDVSLFKSDTISLYEKQDYVVNSSESIGNTGYTQPIVNKYYSLCCNDDISIFSSASATQNLGERLLLGMSMKGNKSTGGGAGPKELICNESNIVNLLNQEQTLDSILYTYYYYTNTGGSYYPSIFLYLKNNYYPFSIHNVIVDEAIDDSNYSTINQINILEKGKSDFSSGGNSGNYKISINEKDNGLSYDIANIGNQFITYNSDGVLKNPLIFISSVTDETLTNFIYCKNITFTGLLTCSSYNETLLSAAAPTIII